MLTPEFSKSFSRGRQTAQRRSAILVGVANLVISSTTSTHHPLSKCASVGAPSASIDEAVLVPTQIFCMNARGTTSRVHCCSRFGWGHPRVTPWCMHHPIIAAVFIVKLTAPLERPILASRRPITIKQPPPTITGHLNHHPIKPRALVRIVGHVLFVVLAFSQLINFV